jgi:hypothetical protein
MFVASVIQKLTLAVFLNIQFHNYSFVISSCVAWHITNSFDILWMFSKLPFTFRIFVVPVRILCSFHAVFITADILFTKFSGFCFMGF